MHYGSDSLHCITQNQMTIDCFFIVTGSQITPEGKEVSLELERGFTVQ